MLIGLVAHLLSRLWRRPVWLVIAPGVLVLVLGRAMEPSSTSSTATSTSIETGFQMFLTAAAIVFGLLIADVVGAQIRARR